ncbi:MAG TPA: hypothetical protein P5114_05695 [Hyphomicrobiaceae bacterium]|nr:hypothetical protein [Hyphomicrobiaceae bacterium]
MTSFRFAALLGGVFVVLVHLATAAVATDTDFCFEDWSIAARIVKRERLTTVAELAGAARNKLDGAIVRTSLCREKGDYVYRLVIRDDRGQLSRRSVDARKPF